MENQDTNARKCYNCGKIFNLVKDLERHKNRKTPCLIREVAPEHINNPNRCIFCNKVFIQKQTLTRHHKSCKIKNGGMEILVDKVKYEQEIRILKEQMRLQNEKMEQLQKQMDEMKKKEIAPAVQTINNNNTQIIQNNTQIIQNITINNYLKPSLKHLFAEPLSDSPFLKLFKENLVQTPIALVPLIWFNPNVPENLSIYLVNKLTGEVLAYQDGNWKVNTKDNIGKELRNRVYEIVENALKIPSIQQLCTNNFVAGNIAKNKSDDMVLGYELEKINNQLLDGRHLVEPLTKKK